VALTIPVGQIHAEAHARRFDVRGALAAAARVLWTVVLAVPYVAGWTVRKIWLALVMLATAAAVGWVDAGRPRTPEGGDDG
jgi:hypothetical protein